MNPTIEAGQWLLILGGAFVAADIALIRLAYVRDVRQGYRSQRSRNTDHGKAYGRASAKSRRGGGPEPVDALRGSAPRGLPGAPRLPGTPIRWCRLYDQEAQ